MTAVPSVVEDTLAALLHDGLFIDGDWVESKDQDPNGEVRLIQLADVGDGEFRDRSSRFLTAQKAKELRCTFLEPGDVLVARMPEPLGRACIFPGVDQPAVTAVDVCVLRPNADRLRPEWLVKAINSPSFRSSMQQFVRGTTRQRISRKNLGSLQLRVPTVPEQISLACALDAVDDKRSGADLHVSTAHRILGRLRQALLASACLGRLTEAWRDSNTDVTGQELVSQLDDERGRRPTRRVSKRSSPGEPPSYEIPEGWAWARLANLAASIEYGYTAPSTREQVGPQMLRITDIQNESVNWSTVPYCKIDSDKEERYRLAEGDLLFARTGATTGKSYLVRNEPPPAVFASYLIRVRLEHRINREYIYAFFRSLLYWQQIVDASVGTGQPNVNGTKLANLWIPLPGAREQIEIVRQATALLSASDSLAARVALASEDLERLTQSVLAKAFRGELITEGGSGALL